MTQLEINMPERNTLDTDNRNQHPVCTTRLSVTVSQDHSVGETVYKRYQPSLKGLYNLLYSPIANNVTIVDNTTMGLLQ